MSNRAMITGGVGLEVVLARLLSTSMTNMAVPKSEIRSCNFFAVYSKRHGILAILHGRRARRPSLSPIPYATAQMIF